MDAAARREALVEVYNQASVCELCPPGRDPEHGRLRGAGMPTPT